MKQEGDVMVTSSLSADEAVIEFLNSEVPTLDDLSRKKVKLLKDIRAKIDALRRNLDLDDNEVYLEAKRRANEIDQIIGKGDALHEAFEEAGPKAKILIERLEPLFQEISAREKKIERYRKMEQVELLSSSVQATLVIGAFDRTLTTFAELSSFAEPLIKAEEEELSEFAKQKVLHWYGYMKDQVAGNFEESLKALNWPFLSTSVAKMNTSSSNPADGEKNVLDEFRKDFLQLLLLKLPDSLSDTTGHPEGPLFRDWKPISPPIMVMIRPLRKRFYFHFYGDRKTNNIEKPEWYINQVMSWIKDHGPFLSTVVQPYVNTLEGVKIDVKMEFIRGLVALVLEKLWKDLPRVLVLSDEEEYLFPHYVDEILTLEQELKEVHDYPSRLPTPVNLLMEEQYFQKWIQVEKRLASSHLDEMLAPSGGVDAMLEPMSSSFRRPACADGLLSLLQSMTGRARGLHSLTRRAQFLRLQLDLLDDFRLRLRQMSKRISPGNRKWAALINGFYAVRETLISWSDDTFYVELWEDPSARHLCEELSQSLAGDDDSAEQDETFRRSRLDSIKKMLKKPLQFTRQESTTVLESNSVFHAIIGLYSHLLQEMLSTTIDYIYTDVRARSLAYRRNDWLVLPSLKKDCNIGLSPSACEMFLLLRDWLHEVSEWLEESLFQKVWQRLAEKMNRLIYDQVILANRFNPGGAAQLRFDVLRNLVPLFAVYTTRPKHYFRESIEAISLLCLAPGSAILLRDVIRSALHGGSSDKPQDPLAALQDVGVFRLSVDEAELVLSLRVEGDSVS